MRERDFQAKFITTLNQRFPGCLILKNDPSYRQGIPDIVMLYNDRWAAFEFKSAHDASVRPNQKHYVDLMDQMSFAAFVDPDTEEEVLNALQFAFSSDWAARRPKCK